MQKSRTATTMFIDGTVPPVSIYKEKEKEENACRGEHGKKEQGAQEIYDPRDDLFAIFFGPY